MEGLQAALVAITPEAAKTLLPENYTGFIPSDGKNYAPIQAAGKAVDILN